MCHVSLVYLTTLTLESCAASCPLSLPICPSTCCGIPELACITNHESCTSNTIRSHHKSCHRHLMTPLNYAAPLHDSLLQPSPHTISSLPPPAPLLLPPPTPPNHKINQPRPTSQQKRNNQHHKRALQCYRCWQCSSYRSYLVAAASWSGLRALPWSLHGARNGLYPSPDKARVRGTG
jgi:hypothetical protein